MLLPDYITQVSSAGHYHKITAMQCTQSII